MSLVHPPALLTFIKQVTHTHTQEAQGEQPPSFVEGPTCNDRRMVTCWGVSFFFCG